MYSINDFYTSLEFALISEGILKSDKVFDDMNVLKVRLHSLVNSSHSTYFDYPEYINQIRHSHQHTLQDHGRIERYGFLRQYHRACENIRSVAPQYFQATVFRRRRWLYLAQ